MEVSPIRTRRVEPNECDIEEIIDENLDNVSEGSILAVTSKVVSLCEGRVVEKGKAMRRELAIREADRYIDPEPGKRGMLLTLKDGILGFNAGIDSLNSHGYHVLWPNDPQGSANRIRKHVTERFGLKDFGVIITDTRSEPLRRGASGMALAGSGFAFVSNHRGRKDLFGKDIWLTESNVLDSLAVAAVLAMGECDEQTPLAMISDVPFVEFRNDDPTGKEIADYRVRMEDDYYAPLFGSLEWKKGGRGK